MAVRPHPNRILFITPEALPLRGFFVLNHALTFHARGHLGQHGLRGTQMTLMGTQMNAD